MTEPVPQRIGDAERDRAAGFLQEHLAQGRLSQEEFDDRVGAALSARTAADLAPLFSDLPAPRPDGELEPTTTAWPAYTASGQPPAASTSSAPVPAATPATPATPSKPPVALTVLAAAAWPAWLLLMFATSWNFWWFVFIPIIISSVVGKLYGDQDQDRVHGRHRHRHRELGN